MKKFICLFISCMLLFPTATADILTIDTSTATDEEVNEMLNMLQSEKINRIKTRLANEVIEPDADELIMFRNIPWYSSRKEAETILGLESSSSWMGNLYRLSYIDYSNISSGADTVEGELGCRPYYNDLTVAGYKPSDTYLCCMFPVVDGEIIRDISIAQVYMGYYTFESDDFGDLSAIYTDLESKLNALYGKGNYTSGDYHTNTIWKDAQGNMIRLQVNSSQSWLTLAYVASDANARIEALAQAYLDEKTRQEELLRLENTNNTDGL